MRTAALLLLALATHAGAARNVLLIVADDYGVDSSSLYNTTAGATAPTPQIAALAATGVRFTQAYAYPVCSPTRSCMLTGRHGFRTGVGNVVTTAAGNSLTAAELTLPEVISQQSALGIQTACFGKWHLSAGPGTAAAPNSIGGWPHYAGSTGGVLASYTSWSKVTNGVTANSTVYATTDVVNDAVTWIRARSSANQPWFAWVAFNAPHTPFHNPPVSLHGYGASPATNLLKYRAAVESMDTEIGRLLLAVDAATTHILFIGDNGTPGQVIQPPYDSAHAKDSLYEGGIRVPLIASGPDIVAGGRTSHALVHAVDVFSTVLDLAGVPQPTAAELDSISLKAILANQSASVRTRLYSGLFDQASTTAGGRILRDDRYKIIRSNSGSDEFFDLTTDPAEATSLLASGISAMNAWQQAHYYRLRFNLGDYNSATTLSALSQHTDANGFHLTVPRNATALQSLWGSADLDFWAPIANATQATGSGTITFTAPAPLPGKAFFSVLTETP